MQLTRAILIKSLLIVFVVIRSFSTIAQASRSDPTDIQGWFNTTLAFDLPKKWSAEIDYQARLFNNLNTFNGSYYSFGVEKKVNRFLAISAEYRLAKVLKGTYNRFSFGLVADKKWKSTKVDLRLLYQNQVQDFDDPAGETDKDNFFRARLRLRKQFDKKLFFSLSFEPIYRFSPNFTIDNYRFQTGFRYTFLKQLSAEVFYINRPDYAKSYKRQYHIVGAGVQYEIGVKSKKS